MKDLYKHLKQHPAHAILGAMLVLTGLNLIFTHHYYFWPPYVVNTLNGDLPGTWALLSGLGLIYVAVQKRMPINVNKVWIISASGFLGFETVLEFGHAIIGRNPHTFSLAIADATFLLLVFFVARKSDNSDRKNKK